MEYVDCGVDYIIVNIEARDKQSEKMERAASSPGSSISVIARFRPLVSIEQESAESVRFISPNTCEILGESGAQPFSFDHIFGPDSTQKELFDTAVKNIVDGVLQGFNGAVLAYGQTGAGKSHTMMGGVGQSRGATPRMLEYLFQSARDCEITVSYLEIYKEKIRDLLEPSSVDLKLCDKPGGGFAVRGLRQVTVSTAAEVFEVMKEGSANRSVAATNMNQNSSRSHSIFSVEIHRFGFRSRLFLVDLAGSEKAAKTGARGLVLEEAAMINKSLSTLGMVVNALASKSVHVPYRDSKLTRILQDSLGGNSRTSLILCCSPSELHVSETIGSLRFGLRASTVRQHPRSNMEVDSLEGAVKELLQWRSGQRPPESMWVDIGTLRREPARPPSSLKRRSAGIALEAQKSRSEDTAGLLAEMKRQMESKGKDLETAKKCLEGLIDAAILTDTCQLKHNICHAREEYETLKSRNHRLRNLLAAQKKAATQRGEDARSIRAEVSKTLEQAEADKIGAESSLAGLERRLTALGPKPVA